MTGVWVAVAAVFVAVVVASVSGSLIVSSSTALGGVISKPGHYLSQKLNEPLETRGTPAMAIGVNALGRRPHWLPKCGAELLLATHSPLGYKWVSQGREQ
jgi:hypothetical protein